jgi:undecaprenyl-diphosphatase
MPQPLRRPAALAGVIAALVLTALAAVYAAGGVLGGFDRTEPPQEGIGPPLRPVALVIDFCGEPLGAALLVAALTAACLLLHRPRLAVLAVAAPAATVATTTALKHAVGRTIHGGYLSFPSGHTALATALAYILALLVLSTRPTAVPHRTAVAVLAATTLTAAVVAAWAQVALGAHYPTDTAGGFCTALAVVPTAAWLLDRPAHRDPSSRSAVPSARS